MLTPTTKPTMFANGDRVGRYLDLLDDPRIFVAQRDFAAAVGTRLVEIVKKVIDFRFFERFSLMAWVSRLATRVLYKQICVTATWALKLPKLGEVVAVHGISNCYS